MKTDRVVEDDEGTEGRPDPGMELLKVPASLAIGVSSEGGGATASGMEFDVKPDRLRPLDGGGDGDTLCLDAEKAVAGRKAKDSSCNE